MEYLQWVVSPVCGAVIGYFTNWLAIKMLFRPHREIRVFGFKLPFTPGLIPKERVALSTKIADSIAKNIITPEVLNKSLNSAEAVSKISNEVSALIDSVINSEMTVADLIGEKSISKLLTALNTESTKLAVRNKLPDVVAAIKRSLDNNDGLNEKIRSVIKTIAKENFGKIVGLFVNYDNIYDNIKKGLFEYLEDEKSHDALVGYSSDMLGKIIEADKTALTSKKVKDIFALLPDGAIVKIKEEAVDVVRMGLLKGGLALAGSLNISKAVEDKISDFDLPTIENIILDVAKKQLNMITVFGGVLGFIIGFAPLIFNLITGR